MGDISVEVCVEGLRKDPGKGERTVSKILSHFCKRDVLGKMSSHIGNCVVDDVMDGLFCSGEKGKTGE